MNFKKLLGLKTSDDHIVAAADLSKEISTIESRAAELRSRLAIAPFEDETADVDSMRREIADAEGRVRMLQEIAQENERRRKAAAAAEAMAEIEEEAAAVRTARAALIRDVVEFRAIARQLPDLVDRIQAARRSLGAAETRFRAAGREDLVVSDPLMDVRWATAKDPVHSGSYDELIGVTLPHYWPPRPPGHKPTLERLEILPDFAEATAPRKGGFLKRLAAE